MSVFALPAHDPYISVARNYSQSDDARSIGIPTRIARSLLDTTDVYSTVGRSTFGGVALDPLEKAAGVRTAAQDGQIIGATIVGVVPTIVTRVAGKAGELGGAIIGSVFGVILGAVASIVSKVTGEDYGSFKEVFLDMVDLCRSGFGRLAAVIPSLLTDLVMLVGAAIGWGIGKGIDAYRVRQLAAQS